MAGSAGLRRRSVPIASEKAITAAVIEHWRASPMPLTCVFSIPNAGALGQPGLTKGVADLCAIGPGFVGFIELKKKFSGKEQRTEAQLDFARLCMSNKIPYQICYGRDEPITTLRGWRIIR